MSPRPAATAAGVAASLLCATALAPLFAGVWWWLGPVLVATAVATATAVLGRRLRWPEPVGVLVGLVGLVETLTLLSARETAAAGIIPTPRTLRTLSDLVGQGRADISRLAVPVPHRPGLVVLTVIGTYLVTMLVDLVVVTLGKPTLAGLPLLGLFAVPAAVLPHGVGIVPFLLGAAGYLVLLLVDDREAVGRWGRLVSSAGERSSRRPSVLAIPIAAGAVATAVALSVAAPALGGINLVNSDGSSTEGGSTSVTQPIVTVAQRLHSGRTVDLIRVRTATPTYLRTTALEDFDGNRFTLRALRATAKARISNGLPPPNISARGSDVDETIQVSPALADPYLPLPGVPTDIRGLTGDWRLSSDTSTVFSTRTTSAGKKFEVQAIVANPTEADLAGLPSSVPDALRIDLALPRALDPRIGELARKLTEFATTSYDKALAIQDYFHLGLYTYDLAGAPTSEAGALSEFLFTTKRGYCEQFASAMAVMLRTLGIPTRVAIGYTGGTRQADGTYLITNQDAHAWPEAWFATTGWLRFEPTVSGAGGNATVPDYAPLTSSDTQPAGRNPTAGAQPRRNGQDGPTPAVTLPPAGGPTTAAATPAASSSQGAAGAGGHGGGVVSALLTAVTVIAGLACVVALLALPALIRVRRRRRRLRDADTLAHPDGPAGGGTADGGTADGGTAGGGASSPRPPLASAAAVHAVWDEVCDLAADFQMRVDPAESPRALAARLAATMSGPPPAAAREIEGARLALGRIAQARESALYAPEGRAAPITREQLAADIRLVTRRLRATAGFGGRARATLAPVSVFDRMDAGQLVRRRWAKLAEAAPLGGGSEHRADDERVGVGVRSSSDPSD